MTLPHIQTAETILNARGIPLSNAVGERFGLNPCSPTYLLPERMVGVITRITPDRKLELEVWLEPGPLQQKPAELIEKRVIDPTAPWNHFR